MAGTALLGKQKDAGSEGKRRMESAAVEAGVRTEWYQFVVGRLEGRGQEIKGQSTEERSVKQTKGKQAGNQRKEGKMCSHMLHSCPLP